MDREPFWGPNALHFFVQMGVGFAVVYVMRIVVLSVWP